ncbi:hypothetical protein SRA_03271 [Streptococcus ratti FA-1 = DSM 20564]|uniref:Uncharacterized protein n=1 Tax=Streptococcus ratti FA-1 = DSM 20564 TaxID=699248 RepID=A0ABP2QXF4_STRRT|nr:hypothetical protein SRA_03271 [Streptococcus ratti FA-1 = DSM 20564]
MTIIKSFCSKQLLHNDYKAFWQRCQLLTDCIISPFKYPRKDLPNLLNSQNIINRSVQGNCCNLYVPSFLENRGTILL